MTDFTLDDIEETFREDMKGTLARMGVPLAHLNRPFLTKSGDELLERQAAADTLASVAHTVKGTAALVGAEGLRGIAAITEELAERARDAAREGRIHLERARFLGESLHLLANALPQAVELELVRKREDSDILAQQLKTKTRRALLRDTAILAAAHAPPPQNTATSFAADSDSTSLSALDEGFIEIADGPKEVARDPATFGVDSLARAFQLEAFASSSGLGPHLRAMGAGLGGKQAALAIAESLFDAARAFDTNATGTAVADAREAMHAAAEGNRESIRDAVDMINEVLILAGAPSIDFEEAVAPVDSGAAPVIGAELAPVDSGAAPVIGAELAPDRMVSVPAANAPQQSATTTASVPQEDEMLVVFRDELIANAPGIEVDFARLSSGSPDVRAIAEILRKQFHSIKGAAAMVGQEEIRTLAVAVERDLRNFRSARPNVLARLGAQINEIFAKGGLPNRVAAPELSNDANASAALSLVDSSPRGFDSAIIDAELLEVFQGELQGTAPELVLAFNQVERDPSLAQSWAVIKRVMHQLKGAAATVGLNEVAAIAADLQTLAAAYVSAAPTVETANAFRGKVAKLFTSAGANLGKVSAPVASVPPPPSLPDQDILVLFQEQLQAASVGLNQLADELTRTGANTRATKAILEDARALAHRTAGTARTVGNETVGNLAKSLEQQLEKGPTASKAAQMIHAFIVAVRPQDARLSISSSASMLDSSSASSSSKQRTSSAETFSIEAIDSPELWEAFTMECTELLDEQERLSLALERSTSPKSELAQLLRVAHTLKGAVNTMQILPTGKLLHSVEDFLEKVGEAALVPPPTAIATVMLDVIASVRKNVEEAPTGKVSLPLARLQKELADLLGIRFTAGMASSSGSQQGAGSQQASGSHDGIDDSQTSANTSGGGSKKAAQVVRVATKRLDNLMNFASELVINRSRVASRVSRLRSIVNVLDGSRKQLSTTVEGFRDRNEFANKARRPQQGGITHGSAALQVQGFGELEFDRYDDIEILSRRVGEVENDFEVLFKQFGEELRDLGEDTDGFGTLVSGIQAEVTQARLTPLDLLFTRLRLPVRDAARRSGVSVLVHVEGGGTLIDKTLADALFAPLLHIVRNSVAHGIETTGERGRLGKAAEGQLRLRGREESGEVVIEVEDDGRGLDLDGLRGRGIAMGVLDPGTSVDDPRVREMIFVSGLSTRETAGDVAGRGLGGDIVKRGVERLNGSVEVETVRGKSTLIRIRLPASLAIAKVFITESQKKQFAVPMFFAERMLEVAEVTMTHSNQEHYIKYDNELIRAFSVAELTRMQAFQTAHTGTAVVMRVGVRRFALIVDRVLGQEDAVIKTAGDLLNGHPLFAGVTLRGNGQMLLVLDIPSIGDLAATAQARGRVEKSKPEARKLEPVRRVPEAIAKEIADEPSVTRRVRVLYVDDSLSVRKVAEKMLAQLGAEVTVAVDGVEALEKLRGAEFDLVFSDIEMPRMHGYELVREIRFLPNLRELPVIMVTSRSGAKHREEATQAGATGYLTKPFNMQSLQEMIQRWGKKPT
jgi:chemosensory pili system protein ChpA (sensor histidine kinase/response regulator)